MGEPVVTIYNGPLSWYERKLRGVKRESFFMRLMQDEEDRRNTTMTIRGGGYDDPPSLPERPRPGHLEMLSSDFTSVSDHVIQNFGTHIHRIRPTRISLHNPPQQVALEVTRRFNATVKTFTYPDIPADALQTINEQFNARVVGQRRVKRQLLSVLHELTRPERTKPLVLMFFGPSGVGKTETARFLNEQVGGTLLRKQFSMFHSEKFANYLFGGSHSEGSFARDLLDREPGVVLIDEFDKANEFFFSAFFELFDEGVFEDKNYRVQVGPAIIICTSNYASTAEVEAAVGDALASRFDAMIEFAPLSGEHLTSIAKRLLRDRHAALREDERALVDLATATDHLAKVIKADGNVRRLGKQVDELVSRMVVDKKYPEPPHPAL